MVSGSEGIAALAIIVSAASGWVGYSLAGRNEEARDLRTAQRESAARQALRSERLEDERHGFQRQLLLDLQDALRTLTRTTSLILRQDLATLNERGALYQVGRDLNEAAFNANIDFGRLTVRVLDYELRAELGQFHEETVAMVSTRRARKSVSAEVQAADIESDMADLTARYEVVNDLLGERLRGELGRAPT